MKIDPQWLMTLISDSGFNPRAYSGRGMYGRNCVGFVSDETQLRAIAQLILSCEDTEEAARVVRGMAQDSMGLDRIYYWPRVSWPEE
jgi:hypothetical protein